VIQRDSKINQKNSYSIWASHIRRGIEAERCCCSAQIGQFRAHCSPVTDQTRAPAVHNKAGHGTLARWIEPHVPVWEKSDRDDGTFSRTEFAWSEQDNSYGCPGGKVLRSNWRAFKVPRTGVTKADTIIYRASEHDCRGCSLKEQCCPNTPMRKITRSIHEYAREVARNIATAPQYLQSRYERKKIEIVFAHLKRILRLDRFRLRGLHGAHDQFLMAAIAQNLRRMAKRLMPTVQEPQQKASPHSAQGRSTLSFSAAID